MASLQILSKSMSQRSIVHMLKRNIHVEKKLLELGVQLPTSAAPAGNYVSCVRSGNLLFLAGHLPFNSDGFMLKGKVGDKVTVDEGYQAAKCCAIGLLSTLKKELGDLDKVVRIVKVTGMVNCTSEFESHPAVINGASDLLAQAFGDAGKHARVAAGYTSLPFNASVEVDLVVEVSA
eukprot:Colp12_sorted_trinity150504_noHs@25694